MGNQNNPNTTLRDDDEEDSCSAQGCTQLVQVEIKESREIVEEISTEWVNVITTSELCNICHADLFELDLEESGQLCIMDQCNHYCHRCFISWMKT